MSQKLCSKESTYSREALQGIKNHYMEEEDPWRYFFLEINNYIHEKIIWIWTLIPLSFKIQIHWPSLAITTNSNIWNVRYTNISASTFRDIYSFLQVQFINHWCWNSFKNKNLTRPEYIAMENVFERQCPQPILNGF